MTLSEIAAALVDGIKTNKTRENLDVLYAPDAVSVEAMDMGQGRETAGLDGIKGKHDWWDGAFEVLEADVKGPYLFGPDRFALHFEMKARNKDTGAVEDMAEVGIYTARDGKIVREEFFYGQ